MPSEVFVVLLNDRHADIEPEVFAGEDAAVAFARAEALKISRNRPEEIEEYEIQGWTLYLSIGPEVDSVRVQRKAVRHG